MWAQPSSHNAYYIASFEMEFFQILTLLTIASPAEFSLNDSTRGNGTSCWGHLSRKESI